MQGSFKPITLPFGDKRSFGSWPGGTGILGHMGGIWGKEPI